jgi:O-antigen/teichoic acid export membrane protein
VTEKTAGRSLGTVGIAVLIAAGLGYPLLIVTARTLSPADNAVFLTFWGIVFGVGSTLAPVEQELSRLAAVADVAGKRADATGLRTVAVAAAAVGLFGLLVALPPVSERLFGEHTVLALVALASGLAFAVQFGTRGTLIGFHEAKSFGGLVVSEAAVRIGLLGLFVVLGLNGVVPLAIAVAAGSFAFLPFAFRVRKHLDLTGGAEPWGVVARRILVLMLSAGLTASVLTGYPAIVKLFATTREELEALSGLFLALTVARLPLLLLSPVQAMAVPTVVRLSQDEEGHGKLRALLVKGSAGAFGLAAVGAAFGWLIGPWAVKLLFGAQYDVPGWVLAGLVWSSVLLGAVMLLAAVLVARTEGAKVLVLWALVAALSVLVLTFAPGDLVLRAVLGLVVAPTIGAFVAMAFVLRPGVRAETSTG